MNELRSKVAMQIGNLMLANIELSHELEAAKAKTEQLGQRLHEIAGDERERTGQVPPPDEFAGS